MPPKTYTTSELADAAACGSQTLRYYERRGLLPEPPRTVGGHRIYGPQHLERLLFIQRIQCLGFHLDEIHELLAAKENALASSSSAEATLDWFIKCVDEKATALSEMRASLADLRAQAQRDIDAADEDPAIELGEKRVGVAG
jgi:DNA-binding transcriptional MerR regulator